MRCALTQTAIVFATASARNRFGETVVEMPARPCRQGSRKAVVSGADSCFTPEAAAKSWPTVTGLVPGRTYTFEITATDADGTGPSSAPSNPGAR